MLSLPTLQPGTTAPAAQLFAVAIQAADRQDRLAADRPSAPAADPLAALGLVHAVTTVTAAASTGQSSLDLHAHAWPAQMIERIEQLRDAADAGSTRIRVVPDALGSIDVSLRRHDDGTVQVALAADRAPTQALIAEARPELARLGEARGLRFADGGLGNGGGSASGQPDANPGQRRATVATPIAAALSDDPSEPADGRVA